MRSLQFYSRMILFNITGVEKAGILTLIKVLETGSMKFDNKT